MTFVSTFYLTNNGLFDFDLTFWIENFLFLILSLIITYFFILPITSQLSKRKNLLINWNYKLKLLLLINIKKKLQYFKLLKDEKNELDRNFKYFQTFITFLFQEEIKKIQQLNFKFIKTVKKNLIIRSTYLILSDKNKINTIFENFFEKKY